MFVFILQLFSSALTAGEFLTFSLSYCVHMYTSLAACMYVSCLAICYVYVYSRLYIIMFTPSLAADVY